MSVISQTVSAAPGGPCRSAPSEWQGHLRGVLDGFAREYSGSSAGGVPERLHAEFVRLLTGLAFAALLEASGRAPRLDSVGVTPPGELFQRLLERVTAPEIRCFSDVDEPFELLRQQSFSEGLMRQTVDVSRQLALQASGSADGAVRELGVLHEILLRARFEQLHSPARRLRSEGAWLSPAWLLDCAPELRSRRLQGELGLSKHQIDRLAEPLARAATVVELEFALEGLFVRGGETRPRGAWVIQPSLHQRRSGAHYTPWPLCERLVADVLGPLVSALPEPRSERLLALKICDPAMGAGCFLLAVAHHVARALVDAWRCEGLATDDPPDTLARRAQAQVARRVIYGVDKSPTAVSLARMSLWLFGGAEETREAGLTHTLRHGDALLGNAPENSTSGTAERDEPAPPHPPFDWQEAFPEVFRRDNPGFDALVGNPPWVAFVGRAAQPLEPKLAAYYSATNPAFKRYRTLHGLFVYRSATLLRQRGRLGLILPTSVADLDGYRDTRAAHDALCDVDAELPDWGDGAFAGVFQPAMALLSTRRETRRLERTSGVWPLSGEDLSSTERQLLERLSRLPRLPPELFGERGFQTSSDDRAHLRHATLPHPPFLVPLREGADIGEFCALPPRVFAAAERLGSPLRPASEWQKVSLLIRQTARFPIAARADGVAFRNSILAGFESADWPASVLLCWLNSTLARWLHYRRHRDARQGMPQLKIGHLRALPALPRGAPLKEIEQLGRDLGSRNASPTAAERATLDGLISELFSLTASERGAIERWSETCPAPVLRRRAETAEPRRPAGLPTS